MFVYYRTFWKNRPAKFIENPALFIEFEESYIHTNKYLVAKSIKIYFNRNRLKNEIFTEEKKEFNICFFISSEIKIQWLFIPWSSFYVTVNVSISLEDMK